MFYVGTTFDTKENKQYKTEKSAVAAAEKAQTRVYDDDGKVIADYTVAEAAQEDSGSNAPDGAIMTNNVPDGALDDKGDGVNVYDEDGNIIGKLTAAEMEDLIAKITDGDSVRIQGKIRRVFDGLLRIRNAPSWDKSAEAGVTNFTEKKVVAVLNVDEKPMYKTADGYYITGDPALVKYISE